MPIENETQIERSQWGVKKSGVGMGPLSGVINRHKGVVQIRCPRCDAFVSMVTPLSGRGLLCCSICEGVIEVFFEGTGAPKVAFVLGDVGGSDDRGGALRDRLAPMKLPIEISDGGTTGSGYREKATRSKRRFRLVTPRTRWSGLVYAPFSLAISMVFCIAVALTIRASPTPWPILLVLLPVGLLAAYSVANVIDLLFNSIVLEIYGGVLSVRAEPFRRARRSISIPIEDIAFVTTPSGNRDGGRRGLKVVLRDGGARLLHVKDLVTDAELSKLRLEVAQFLAKERVAAT